MLMPRISAGTMFDIGSSRSRTDRYHGNCINEADPMTTAAATTPERLEFKTELKQLLDLIIHSLYTKKEIFLRELISNSADAIDKLRFEALQHPELAEGDTNWRIKLIPDEKAGTLTVSDNGVGM